VPTNEELGNLCVGSVGPRGLCHNPPVDWFVESTGKKVPVCAYHKQLFEGIKRRTPLALRLRYRLAGVWKRNR